MAADQTTDSQRGIGALLRDLAEGSASLVRQEVRLARIEFTGVLSGVGSFGASVTGRSCGFDRMSMTLGLAAASPFGGSRSIQTKRSISWTPKRLERKSRWRSRRSGLTSSSR